MDKMRSGVIEGANTVPPPYFRRGLNWLLPLTRRGLEFLHTPRAFPSMECVNANIVATLAR